MDLLTEARDVLAEYIELADAANSAPAHELLKAVDVERVRGNQARARELLQRLQGGEHRVRVLVALEGGIVQGVVADQPRVDVTVLDYDTDGADVEEVYDIPQSGGGTAEAHRYGFTADHDPAFLDGAEGAQLTDPEAAAKALRKLAKAWREVGRDDWADEETARAEEIERAWSGQH